MQNAEFVCVKDRDLQFRTKQFALQVIQFCEKLRMTKQVRFSSGKLLRPARRSARITVPRVARSLNRLFISKMSDVLEEADECGIGSSFYANREKLIRKPPHQC